MIEKISGKRVTPAHPLGKENIARLLSVCGSARAMLGGGNARAGVNGEFLNNSINMDKFTGFFDKFPKIHSGMNFCKILKNDDLNKNMSAGRSDKGPRIFFSLRICPQIR